MKKLIVILSVLLLIGQGSWAMQPSVVGGIRDSLAGGLMIENPVARNMGIRFGVEATSGSYPLVLFFEGKFQLSYVGYSPMSLGVGIVGYSGKDTTQTGLSLSIIFNRFLNIIPLYAQFGADFINPIKLQAQIGYKIY